MQSSAAKDLVSEHTLSRIYGWKLQVQGLQMAGHADKKKAKKAAEFATRYWTAVAVVAVGHN